MIETARITFYEITECGFYKAGSKHREFGSFSDIITKLKDWTDGQKLGDTKVFDEDTYKNLLPVYSFDLFGPSNGSRNYLFTTWNQTPELDGGMASVDLTSNVGSPQVAKSKVPKNHIAGYPTYFWLVPSKDILATVTINSTMNGQNGLKVYFRDFMANYAPYRTFNGNGSLVGYRPGPGAEPEVLYPKFSTRLKTNPGKINVIKSKRPHIRKTIRKQVLDLEEKVNHPIKMGILRSLGLSKTVENGSFNQAHKLRFEFDHTPSEEEIDLMIRQVEQMDDNKYCDIGFQFRGDDSIMWLSHSIESTELLVDIDKTDVGIIEAESLLYELESRAKHLLE